MAEDKRTVGQPKIKIGGTPAPQKIGARDPEPEQSAGKKRGRGSSILIVVLVIVILALLAVAAFLLRPWESSSAAAEPATPEPVVLGEVVAIEPISLNLTEGNYVRLGFSMQLSEDAPEELETARAIDIAIATFSGRTVEEVNNLESRAQITQQFIADLNEAFEGAVVDVYYTDLVTQ